MPLLSPWDRYEAQVRRRQRRARRLSHLCLAVALASVAWLVWWMPDERGAYVAPVFAIAWVGFWFSREFTR